MSAYSAMNPDERRQARLRAKVRSALRKRAETRGGQDDASRLLLTATAALIRALESVDVPPDDRIALKFLADSLVEWRDGTELETAFCIRRDDQGAPKKPPLLSLLTYLPKMDGYVSKGLSVTDAGKKVAAAAGVAQRTVRRAWDVGGGLNGHRNRMAK